DGGKSRFWPLDLWNPGKLICALCRDVGQAVLLASRLSSRRPAPTASTGESPSGAMTEGGEGGAGGANAPQPFQGSNQEIPRNRKESTPSPAVERKRARRSPRQRRPKARAVLGPGVRVG